MTDHPFAARIAARLSFVSLALGTAALLVACGTHQPAAPESSPSQATARNGVVVTAVTYGTTATGRHLSKADDPCDVPASLRRAVQNQLKARDEFPAVPSAASIEGAAVLTMEITDILVDANSPGPQLVQLSGKLERRGQPTARFAARQKMSFFTVVYTYCGAAEGVTYVLGEDIVKWLQKPVDGALLGELSGAFNKR